MSLISLCLIAVGIFGAILAVILFSKGDNKSKKNVEGQGKAENANAEVVAPVLNNEQAKSTKQVLQKNDKNVPRKDMFEFMEFDKIADNMIIQNKGNKFTMVIQCKGINYDLMSEVEQMSVEEGFITFLNTLKFPIQLYVQARAVDLKKSMDIYKNSVDELQSQFRMADDEYKAAANELNMNYDKVREAKDERDKYAHILDYAQDITRYVEKISLNKHVLQRKFYILLSYNKSDVAATAEFTKEELYDICQRELFTRAQTLVSSLSSCSVQGKILNSNEIAELLYISYNRDDEKLLDIRTALDSGFYRLYSTSKDVFQKKEELMQKQVEEEALNRVKDALRQTLRIDAPKTQEELEDEFEERADREAINIINTANIPDEEKEKLTDIIAENHVAEAEKRKVEREKAKNSKNDAKEGAKASEEIDNSEADSKETADSKKNESETNVDDMIV